MYAKVGGGCMAVLGAAVNACHSSSVSSHSALTNSPLKLHVSFCIEFVVLWAHAALNLERFAWVASASRAKPWKPKHLCAQ